MFEEIPFTAPTEELILNGYMTMEKFNREMADNKQKCMEIMNCALNKRDDNIMNTEVTTGKSECTKEDKPDKNKIPFWEKRNLTLEEASKYFNIGVNRIRRITDRNNCPFVLWVGSKRLIKRKEFENYLSREYSI